ncbi:MAG: glutamate formimidoyltransferase [Caldilineaceae bacterium]|nr:glutamate formimidoyltransferase [Caldilineaceae bacterium]
MIEAIPNFSEGRRNEVIDAIVAAMDLCGVLLLDRSSDPDHNRSVVTIAGPPDAVVEALFRGVREAATQIDLFRHRGAHPRLGATDVVPLVPIYNTTLADCVALARGLGQRIGEELGLPVYLYEAAALRPERQSLADVRSGEFEGLLRDIHLPERQPDFGPAKIGSAGAVIVGARPSLIAYNVFLKSGDVTIAKRIARAIRERNGGLPGVRALGLLVGGQAQVSMNLIDFRRTPVHVAVEAIRAEAARSGVEVERSELIGLIPQDALFAAAAHYLQLPNFESSQVVEIAIEQSIAHSTSHPLGSST